MADVITVEFGKKAPPKKENPIEIEADRPFDYDKIFAKHQRIMFLNVIKELMTQVRDFGLVDNHHFYITFDTEIVGAQCPKGYKGDLTIVLQNQFSNLEVDDDGFSVLLSFNQIPSVVRVPWISIVTFADPSVNLGIEIIKR